MNHYVKCPTTNETFYNGLQPQINMILDVSFGGSILFKTAEEAITIIEFMASTDLQGHNGRTLA